MSGRNISVLSGHGFAIPAGSFPAIHKENNSDLNASRLFTWMGIRPAIELLKMTVYSLIVLNVFIHKTEGAMCAAGEFTTCNLTWLRYGQLYL